MSATGLEEKREGKMTLITQRTVLTGPTGLESAAGLATPRLICLISLIGNRENAGYLFVSLGQLASG